jgi:putative oxidoreductase
MAFFKNMAIAGGLFTVAAFGGGAWSVDGKTKG